MTGEPCDGLLVQLYIWFLFLCLLFLPDSLLFALSLCTLAQSRTSLCPSQYLTVVMICMANGMYAVVFGMKHLPLQAS